MKIAIAIAIAIAGAGYVGLSNGILLPHHNEVVYLNIVGEKVAMLNRQKSSIEFENIESFLSSKPFNFLNTLDKHAHFNEANYKVIVTHTVYDSKTFYNG